jgi:MFS transporter, ACS family, solute carrier family 17 (sodium-dependent inorganic phosphate cotransporter), other
MTLILGQGLTSPLHRASRRIPRHIPLTKSPLISLQRWNKQSLIPPTTRRRAQGSNQKEGDSGTQEYLDIADASLSQQDDKPASSSYKDDTTELSTEITLPSNPFSQLFKKWTTLPGRYKTTFATSLAFVICNMDKVNISVAIIPMSQDFGWSPTTTGLVQSSFFYGYLLSQIPGGYIVSRYGGRVILPAGVIMWSAATAAVPVLASTVAGLCISRAAVGLGEGVAPSSATDIVARAIDPKERSRAISFIFGGLHVGSLLGLLVAPPIIEKFGWPVVFYLFGGIGLAWSAWFENLNNAIKRDEPDVAQALAMSDDEDYDLWKTKQQRTGNNSNEVLEYLSTRSDDEEEEEIESSISAGSSGGHGGGVISHKQRIPWRSFLRSTPIQALAYTHFCNNWFHYTMLAWLPTYFTDTLSLDLMKAAQVSILPPTAAIIVSAIAGPTADNLIEQGVDVGLVRKASQCAAFLGPAGCLLLACTTENNGPVSVTLLTLSLGLASFSLAGLYCNHADLSPKYAPVLLGLTNTCGAIPGIMGVAFTGFLFDKTSSWTIALFLPSIFFFITGSLVFALYGTAERQDFSANNEKFAFEAWWEELVGGGADEGKGGR